MQTLPEPPKTYTDFVARFPKLGQAWELASDAGNEGPLDERTRRLIKIAVAIGASREGAVRSGVRKAVAAGISAQEIDHVIALAAGTLGFPATVAIFSWTRDLLDQAGR